MAFLPFPLRLVLLGTLASAAILAVAAASPDPCTDASTPLDRRVFECSGGDDLAALRGVLEEGGRPDGYRKKGMSRLGAAALNGDHAVISLLMQHGADVNLPDDDGDTPLHQAASMGWPKVIVLLLGYGANPTLLNKRGETPLVCAKGYGKAEKVLREAHAEGVEAVLSKYKGEL